MSRKVSLPEGALSVNESGLEAMQNVRPKSGSLSSEDGEAGGPKQSRFFQSLSRSLEPAGAPPKKDYLDAYQQYKAKRAYNLHGIVKQQTIDLGSLNSSNPVTAKPDTTRKLSTGTNLPQHNAPSSEGSKKGPPPPVAPRKKSVNLPPVSEPAVHDTSSYILSAAKKEQQQKTDPGFQKFRSLTGPTVFRPQTGPIGAPKKITPVFTSQNGGIVKENGSSSAQKAAHGDVLLGSKGGDSQSAATNDVQVANTQDAAAPRPTEDNTQSGNSTEKVKEKGESSPEAVASHVSSVPAATGVVLGKTQEEGTVKNVANGLINKELTEGNQIVDNEIPKEMKDEINVVEADKAEDKSNCEIEKTAEVNKEPALNQGQIAESINKTSQSTTEPSETKVTTENAKEEKDVVIQGSDVVELSDIAEQSKSDGNGEKNS